MWAFLFSRSCVNIVICVKKEGNDMRYKYEEGRDLIQDGDIAFMRDTGSIPAWLIRIITRSNYSHVGICFWATIGDEQRLLFIEAQGKTKRRILNFGYYSDRDIDVVRAPLEWKTVCDKALKRVGKTDYTMLGALYVGVRECLWKYVGIKLPTLDFPGEICSEFVAEIYDIEPNDVSPQVLFEQLQHLGHNVDLEIRRKP